MGIKTSALVVSILAGAVVLIFGWFGISLDQTVSRYEVQDETVVVVQSVPVVRVIDGDTLVVRNNGVEETVRVIGIDAPETEFTPGGEECFADEATSAATLLLMGKEVTLTSDLTQDLYDTYGRLLSYVTVDGEDLGQFMLAGGYAKEYTFKGRAYEKQALYRATEETAKGERAGLWDVCSD